MMLFTLLSSDEMFYLTFINDQVVIHIQELLLQLLIVVIRELLS